MDFQALLQAVSTIGFPAVCCLLLFKSNEKESERHVEAEKQLTEIINNNTIALTKLTDKIEMLEDLTKRGESK